MFVNRLASIPEPKSSWRSALWLLCLSWLPAPAAAALHHALEVSVDPARAHIEVTDTVSVGAGRTRLEFDLHPGLTPELLTAGVTLTAVTGKTATQAPALNGTSETATAEPVRYRVILPAGQTRFTVRYRGRIAHALQTGGEEYARQFSETPGTITAAGVFLAGRSHWYPHVRGDMMTFDLDLRLPAGWYGMSQGARTARAGEAEAVREQWRCDSPQEEIYLIAGPFTEYTATTDGVTAMVLLRQPDPALARQYLDATADYVRLYSELIGTYPFSKFALVENFWETGYGMPSFTLLGSKVIRLPFILHSSYPHEILHNWWGNGVYVDYERGNWAEGLTSYLADHLIKEQRGKGVGYRRNTLQKYTDHVRKQQDFPLTAFRSRHSAVTQAVGYGKTLMLFHMLRRELGDTAFTGGLRTLYRENRFTVADYGAVEAAFSAAAQRPLAAFFEQWVTRSGAPQLRLSAASTRPQGDAYLLTAVIEQVQMEAPYRLQVPLAIRLADRDEAWQTDVLVDAKRETIQLALPARPLELVVDPEFDVFRRLHRNEIPPAVSQAMGAERVLVVLPADAPAKRAMAYAELARAWQAGQPGRIEVARDTDLEQLPADRSVWLFGWHNRFRPLMAEALAGYDYEDQGTGVQIDGTALSEEEHALVVLGRRAGSPDQALGWLAGKAVAIPGLGRKLPHYGKYSYLAFTGTAPDNVLKGQWPVVDSPLAVAIKQHDAMPVTPAAVQLAPRSALVDPPATFSMERMQADIARLADDAMQGRGLGTPELDRAADYIAAQMQAAGLQPGAAAGQAWLQTWQADVAALDRTVSLKNVIGILPGSDPARAGESLVIGAHYDHLGCGEYGDHEAARGYIHPGADDNASGVAVLLELARALAGKPQPRSIVFVAFTAEEAARLGSRHFAANAGKYPIDKMIAMINLDTVGRLNGRPLLALGSGTAAEWVHILRGAGYVTGVPVQAVADDIGSSDQTSFIEAGVPAVQLFAGAHADFHRPGDTPDRIDTNGLVKTAQVLKEMAVYLAGRPEALHSTLGAAQDIAAMPAGRMQRRVSLGIVPDYAVSGAGVRIDEVREGTPAAAAGLRAGDIITALNGTPLRDLRDYTAVLKELAPGDTVQITFSRAAHEQQVTARVIER